MVSFLNNHLPRIHRALSRANHDAHADEADVRVHENCPPRQAAQAVVSRYAWLGALGSRTLASPLTGAARHVFGTGDRPATGVQLSGSIITEALRGVGSLPGWAVGAGVGLAPAVHIALQRRRRLKSGDALEQWSTACNRDDAEAADAARERAARAVGMAPYDLERVRSLPMTGMTPLDRARVLKAVQRAKTPLPEFVGRMAHLAASLPARERVAALRRCSELDAEAPANAWPASGPARGDNAAAGYCLDDVTHKFLEDLCQEWPHPHARPFEDVAASLLDAAGDQSALVRRLFYGTQLARDACGPIVNQPAITSGIDVATVLRGLDRRITEWPEALRPAMRASLLRGLLLCVDDEGYRLPARQMGEALVAGLLGHRHEVRMDPTAERTVALLARGVLQVSQLKNLRDDGWLATAYMGQQPDVAKQLIEGGFQPSPDSVDAWVAMFRRAAAPKRSYVVVAALACPVHGDVLRALITDVRAKPNADLCAALCNLVESNEHKGTDLARIFASESHTSFWQEAFPHWRTVPYSKRVEDQLAAWNAPPALRLAQAMTALSESAETHKQAQNVVAQLAANDPDHLAVSLLTFLKEGSKREAITRMMFAQRPPEFWCTARWGESPTSSIHLDSAQFAVLGLPPLVAAKWETQGTVTQAFVDALEATITGPDDALAKALVQNASPSFWLPSGWPQEISTLSRRLLDWLRSAGVHGAIIERYRCGTEATSALRDHVLALVAPRKNHQEGHGALAQALLATGGLAFWASASWRQKTRGNEAAAAQLKRYGLHPLLVAEYKHASLAPADLSDAQLRTVGQCITQLAHNARLHPEKARAKAQVFLQHEVNCWRSVAYDPVVAQKLRDWGASTFHVLQQYIGITPKTAIADLAAVCASGSPTRDRATQLASEIATLANAIPPLRTDSAEERVLRCLFTLPAVEALALADWQAVQATSPVLLRTLGLHELLAKLFRSGGNLTDELLQALCHAEQDGSLDDKRIAATLVKENPAFWTSALQDSKRPDVAAMKSLQTLGLAPALRHLLLCTDGATHALARELCALARGSANDKKLAGVILASRDDAFWVEANWENLRGDRAQATPLKGLGLAPVLAALLWEGRRPGMQLASALQALARDGGASADALGLAVVRRIRVSAWRASHWPQAVNNALSRGERRKLQRWGVLTHLLQNIDPILQVDRNKVQIPVGLTHPFDLGPWKYKIKYVGERGIDDQGLKKDWLGNMLKIWLAPDKGIVAPCGNGTMLYLNPKAVAEVGEDYVRFAGRLVGLALRMNLPTSVPLAWPLFEQMAGRDLDLSALAVFDPILASSLQKVLDTVGMIDDWEQTFLAPSTIPGNNTEIELIPDGANIRVTEATKREFVQAKVQLYINERRDAFEAFAAGIRDIATDYDFSAPGDATSCALRGATHIDCKAWEKATKVECAGVSKAAATAAKTLFFKAVRDLTHEQRSALWHYVTGMHSPPAAGFDKLQHKFTLRFYPLRTHDPASHVCYNILDLPCYTDYAAMRETLILMPQAGSSFMAR